VGGAWPTGRSWSAAGRETGPAPRRSLPGRPRAGAMVAWCHGATGIALTRLRVAEAPADPHRVAEATAEAVTQATAKNATEAVTEAAAGVRATLPGVRAQLDRVTLPDLGLCQGLAGHAATLLEAARRLPTLADSDPVTPDPTTPDSITPDPTATGATTADLAVAAAWVVTRAADRIARHV